MKERARQAEEAAARWDVRLVEGLAAVVLEVGGSEERMVARVMADTEEREKRMAVRLLATEAIEKELAQRALWEEKQWKDMGGLMRLRREDIREVKQTVEGIAAQLAAMSAASQAAAPAAAPALATEGPRAIRAQAAPARPELAAPKAMEGVVATTITPASELQEDPIEDGSDMEGIERKGMFASQHVPELGAPSAAPSPATRKKKGKGKAKEAQIAMPVPTTLARARKASGLVHQQKRQAAVDAKRAEEAKVSPPKVEEPAAARVILKRPETRAGEENAQQKKQEGRTEAEERWGKGDFSKEKEEEYFRAANLVRDLGDGDDEAVRRVAHLAGMRAVAEWWHRPMVPASQGPRGEAPAEGCPAPQRRR